MPQRLNNSHEELVQKAQQLFWTKGYKGVTAQDLAAYLEVSTSTIYNKYTKEKLFLDSLDYYNETCSDPFLKQLREATDGMKSLKGFFYNLIDALLDKTFPRGCLMVNTVVELRNENAEVKKRYESYFNNLVYSYKIVIDKAIDLGQILNRNKKDEYAEFLLGIIFSLSIFFKIKSREEMRQYVDEQLGLMV